VLAAAATAPVSEPGTLAMLGHVPGFLFQRLAFDRFGSFFRLQGPLSRRLPQATHPRR